MKKRNLQMKWTKRIVLIALLLGVAGLGKMYAQEFIVDGLKYSVNDDGISVSVTGPNFSGEGFENEIPSDWATIDADGDGYGWELASWANHTGNYSMASASYIDEVGAVTPDNYLVSGQISFTANIGIRFYACANDANYAAEHFGVAVSTGSQIDVTNFTTIAEWTMTAKSNNMPKGDRGLRDQCSWYEYTVDLSSYAGQIGYVAIRHFNCTDQWYLNVDDVYIGEEYNTSLNIPENVFYEGTSYAVTSIGDNAFKNCSFFTGDLILPNSMTSIGENAFFGCTGFTGSLNIPNSVTSIGVRAFFDCNGLTSINIPNTINSIEERAFEGTGWYATQPDGILYLGNWCLGNKGEEPTGALSFNGTTRGIAGGAFSGCSGLTGSLVIPNSVVYIGSLAFYGCSGFTGDLIIPNSVTKIQNGAFLGCSGLTSLTISNSVTAIGDGAFSHCSSFSGGLTIPNSVTSIGSGAFSYCTGFTGGLNIGNSVTSIGSWAFQDCNGFYSITNFAETPPILGEGSFAGWNLNTPVFVPCGFEEVYSLLSWGAFRNYYEMCGGTVTVVANPIEGGMVTGGGTFETGQICTVMATEYEGYSFSYWELNGKKISSDAEYSFYVAGDMTLVAHFLSEENIVFADAIVKDICVSHWDTNGDGELSYVEAALVTDLNNYFIGNTEITSFEELQYFIGLASISGNAFYNCSGLTGNLIIPSFVTTIGDYAFYNCSGLTDSLTIPNSVITIGSYAFYNCSGFTGSLTIPNSVTTIGNGAFSGCSGFTGSLTIPNSVTTIGSFAFSGCSGFTGSLTIPNSVTTIGGSAFYYCSGFTGSLTIPNSVTEIGGSAFYNCSGFTGNLTIPNSVTTIGSYAFYNCSGFTGNLTIPNSVTTIGMYAFSGCSGFTGSLTVGNSVTTIGGNAFDGCNGFTGSLFLGNSVTTIGIRAFQNCNGFSSVIIFAETPPSLGWLAFYPWSSNNPVFVPCGTLEAYQMANGWSTLSLREMCAGEITATANPIESGTVIGAGYYEGGTACTLTATPNEGYLFLNWSKNGEVVSTDSTYSFIVTGDADFVANFVEEGSVCFITFELYDSYGDGYTGNYLVVTDENGSQQLAVESGSSAVYTLPFLTGSHITLTWIVGSYPEDCSFTVSYSNGNMIYHGENIDANFNYEFDVDCVEMPAITFNVTAVANPIDGGTITGTGQYDYNAICTLTAIANEGYTFVNWTQDGTIVSNDVEYSFYVVDNVAVVASFVPLGNISFADANVKAICVANWDTNEDGELSYTEAAAVTNLGEVFRENTEITSFEELQYFIGLTSISSYAFYGCSNLSGSLYIPNSVTTIGWYAFYNCSGFTGNLTIPNSVTTIGWYAFYNCSGFTDSLTIPNSVTEIGSRAFSVCYGFTGSLTIPNSVTTIGEGAFSVCYGFTGSLTIPNSVTTIGKGAFSGCRGFTGSLTIPNSVTEIGDYAFYNCSGFTGSLTIPNSVTTIGEAAFEGCSGFTGSLTIPNSVTTIGEWAFYNCSGFTGSLTIGNSVTTISYRAFSGCSGFTGSLTIPNSVTTIGDWAFSGCSGFTGSLTIPNSVTEIGRRAFGGRSKFDSIVVESGNTVYDSRESCNALIKTNTNELILGCKNSIIPNSVTSIGDYAFYYCSGFTGSLTIPNSVTSIGDYAFYYCSGFTGSLTIPNSVTTIGESVFNGCSGFTGSLTIGNSVTTIGYMAFYNCSGLTEALLYNSSQPSLGNYTFYNTSFPIYVPYESLYDYKTATNWSYYEDRIFPMAYTTISGYGVGEGNYRFIASPLVENAAPTAVDNMITETPYDLYRFDQSEDDEWRNYKANTEDFVLQNGQGYLYANAEDVNLVFKGEFNEDDTKEVGLAYDATATFAGWNLVGNPFPVNAYANKSYYTMNEEGTAIEPVAVSMETTIPACTGVMVMAEAEGETVVFSTEAPEAATNQGCLQIELSQAVELVETPTRKQDGTSTGSVTALDKAIVSFNAGDRLEKFVFNKENAVISIPQGGKELAIACSDKQGEMPLSFKASKNGEYTLTIHPEAVELDYLHLIDNLTGADVDLLALRQAQGPANYTFEAKTTDYASRFRLVFSGKEADGPSSGSETFAFVNNGNIIITGAEVGATLQIVDMTGRVVASCGGHTRCVPTTGMAKGVYVLRLINGDDVKTQKIVIR